MEGSVQDARKGSEGVGGSDPPNVYKNAVNQDLSHSAVWAQGFGLVKQHDRLKWIDHSNPDKESEESVKNGAVGPYSLASAEVADFVTYPMDLLRGFSSSVSRQRIFVSHLLSHFFQLF